MRYTTISLVIILSLLLTASPADAFDSMRQGKVFSFGIGGVAFNHWSHTELDVSASNSGGYFGELTVGYAWDGRNRITLQSSTAWVELDEFAGDGLYSFGFVGPVWTRFLADDGRSWFYRLGLGIARSGISDGNGPGFLVGGGYELYRHLEVGADLFGGRTTERDNGIWETSLTFFVALVVY